MFDNMHNFYERIVHERVLAKIGKKTIDNDYLEDICCVTLNHLPPRYIRFEVDMIFYLSPVERQEIEDKVDAEIEKAVTIVKDNKRRKRK